MLKCEIEKQRMSPVTKCKYLQTVEGDKLETFHETFFYCSKWMFACWYNVFYRALNLVQNIVCIVLHFGGLRCCKEMECKIKVNVIHIVPHLLCFKNISVTSIVTALPSWICYSMSCKITLWFCETPKTVLYAKETKLFMITFCLLESLNVCSKN